MSSKVITQDRPIPTTRAGFADIVGFGQDGVVILRNGFSVQSFTAIKDFGYNAGSWRIEKHVRLVGDVTGDGTDDIVGFGEDGVLVSLNNGDNTFTSPSKLVLKDFAYSAGTWRVDKHIRYLADIRGTGRCDIVGFGDQGVIVSKNNGNAKFEHSYLAVNDFGYDNGGWRLDRHLRFLGDTTGDGRKDIVGFGENHVLVGRNNGDGNFSRGTSVANGLCYAAGGWRIDKHPRTIADLTGDGRVDLVGFGNAGVSVALNQGNGVFGSIDLVVKNFGVDQGWQVDKHPRFVADLTGDKCGDIIGFGDAGVYVAYNNGNGSFQPTKFLFNSFSVQQGWQVSKHPRFVVDLTGDGRADIIGFGEESVYVAYNDGKGGFEPATILTGDFSFNGGKWSREKTVRWLANLSQAR